MIKARGRKPLRASFDFNLTSLSRALKILPVLQAKFSAQFLDKMMVRQKQSISVGARGCGTLAKRNSLTKYGNGATSVGAEMFPYVAGGEHLQRTLIRSVFEHDVNFERARLNSTSLIRRRKRSRRAATI